MLIAMPDRNKSVVRRLTLELWNERGDASAAHALLAPDLPDRAGYVRRALALRESVSGLRTTTEELIAEGDKVVGRFTCSATHLGEWLGHGPTGHRFERVDEVSIFRFADGKIAHVWSLEDTLERLHQLGLASPNG